MDKTAQNVFTQYSQELDAKLEKMGEGYVGKIQVMRDGTCKLVIGNIEFNITTGLHEPCYQVQL